jgi:hypothetical protein
MKRVQVDTLARCKNDLATQMEGDVVIKIHCSLLPPKR